MHDTSHDANMCKLGSPPAQILAPKSIEIEKETVREILHLSTFFSPMLELLDFTFHGSTKAAPVTVLSAADTVIS